MLNNIKFVINKYQSRLLLYFDWLDLYINW